MHTVFARSVAAATNVFNLPRREATIQERLLFESGVYLFDCALPQELNDYVMVFCKCLNHVMNEKKMNQQILSVASYELRVE